MVYKDKIKVEEKKSKSRREKRKKWKEYKNSESVLVPHFSKVMHCEVRYQKTQMCNI